MVQTVLFQDLGPLIRQLRVIIQIDLPLLSILLRILAIVIVHCLIAEHNLLLLLPCVVHDHNVQETREEDENRAEKAHKKTVLEL